MKTTKLVIGIISLVLFIIISFQSCAAIAVSSLRQDNDTSGGGGLVVGILIMTAGIIGICSRSSKSGGLVAASFYLLSGIFGMMTSGVFVDLKIWALLALIFGAVFLMLSIFMPAKIKYYTQNYQQGYYPQTYNQHGYNPYNQNPPQ